MFRANEAHLQYGMFDTFQQLPEKVRGRLEASWAGTFYRELFVRIDERRFAVLYSDKPSRPNAPVNVLVGAEILKAGHGWSDEELYNNLQFNLQVRYALGLRDIGSVPYEWRTVYNFRHYLSQHMQETGENLLEQVFVQVTDEQLESLKLKTGQQRMDSVLVSSNIRRMTRLHLLVEVVQRVWRMLTEEDQAYYGEAFEPYLRGTAGQYCYKLKGKEIVEHSEAVGRLMNRLVRELEAQYAELPTYQMLQRVVDEHFGLVEGQVESSDSPQIRLKTGKELSADSLQSPDDWEATYREKRGRGHRGYVGNLTETCDPENEQQLITLVQAAPNLTDDEQLAIEAVPDLKARTGVETLWTDGGYIGTEAEKVFREHEIEHIPTNLRGGKPSPDRLALDAFSWETNEEGVPVTVRCPGGQQVEVRPGHAADRFLADFEPSVCQACPQVDRCRSDPLKARPARVLRMSLRQVQLAQLRQRSAWARRAGNNRRSAIESTVRSVTHPFGGQAGKLPVRGQIRVTQVLICSALMVNLRRIWRYKRKQAEKARKDALSLLSCGSRCLRSRISVRFIHPCANFSPAWAQA